MSLQRLAVLDVSFDHAETRPFGPLGSTPPLREVKVHSVWAFSNLPWMASLPESIQALDVTLDDDENFSDDDISSLSKLKDLKTLSLTNDDTFILTAVHFHAVRRVEHLTLQGYWRCPDEVLEFALPSLKELHCSPNTFTLPHYLMPGCMPSLHTLTFITRIYGSRLTVGDVQTLLLCCPSLQEVRFPGDPKVSTMDAEVMRVVRCLVNAYVHPKSTSRLWWLFPSYKSTSPDVPSPVRDEVKDNAGWVRLWAPVEEGSYMCLPPIFEFGIRIEGKAGHAVPVVQEKQG